MPARLVAIGDIHGCTTALDALIRAIDPQPADTIVCLGDYIDRGPDSRGTIDFLLQLSRRCRLIPLLGNHDKMLLGLLAGKEHLFDQWIELGGNRTLDSFRCAVPDLIPVRYLNFLGGCVPFHETSGHLFLHASYLAHLPLEAHPSHVLRWQSLKIGVPRPHYSGKRAIVGHTAQKSGQILDLGHLKCIDTYCYGGGWLTAMDVGSGQVWQTAQNGRTRNISVNPEKGGPHRPKGQGSSANVPLNLEP